MDLVDVDPRSIVVELEAAVQLASHRSAPEHRGKSRERLVDLVLADVQRRQQAQRRRTGRVRHEPLLEQRAARDLRRRNIELAGEHQAATATL